MALEKLAGLCFLNGFIILPPASICRLKEQGWVDVITRERRWIQKRYNNGTTNNNTSDHCCPFCFTSPTQSLSKPIGIY